MEKKEAVQKFSSIIDQISKKKAKQELVQKLKSHSSDIKWLTDDIEKVDYYCNYDKPLKEQIERIEKFSNYITKYFENNPKEKEKMTNAVEELYGFERYVRAMTEGSDVEFEVLNNDEEVSKLSAAQKEILMQANAYRDACMFVESKANDEKSFLDDNLLIRAHYLMESGTSEDIKNFRKLRFRNGSDNLIIELRGFFNPLEGEKVSSRVLDLISNVEFKWEKLNPIEKAARFAVEYIRIQPHMDGNKRIALLGMNYILIKNGLMPIYFKYDEFMPNEKIYENMSGFNIVKQNGFAQDLKEAILFRDLTSVMKTVCNKLESRTVKYVKRIKNNELVKEMNKLNSSKNNKFSNF